MKEKNSKLLAIILSVLTITVVVISVFLIKKDNDADMNLLTVNNASEFFTVNSCLYRITNYVYKKDTASLITVLTSKYKKENKISELNVLDIFPKITQSSTFLSKKMYYKKIGNDVTKYYVYGVIRPNVLHDYDIVIETKEQKAYFIVILDSNKQVFSIEPYDGKVFIGGDKNE